MKGDRVTNNGNGNGGRKVGPIDRVRDTWATAPQWQRWIVYIGLIVFALILPAPAIGSFMSPGGNWTTALVNPIGVTILMAIGLNIVVGMAGLLDLGFVAFYAIGAYSVAYFGTEYGWNFWATMVMGVALAAVSGVILGAPTLRLRGDYLAIVTLGFGEIVRITANNTDEIGGARGITGVPHPPDMLGMEFKSHPAPYFYMMVAAIVLMIILSRRLEISRVGRSWAAIREDEDAAELMGVPTFRFKLLAFATGAFIGSVAGVLFASKANFIQPTQFPFLLSALILVAVVLGGSGNLPGVIIGAFLVAWLPEFFRDAKEYRNLAFGAVLVLLMIFRPEGVLPSRRRQAELAEGTGGMGTMGAEVPGPTSDPDMEVSK
jgi:branched-chain amino acid transport system permease protein